MSDIFLNPVKFLQWETDMSRKNKSIEFSGGLKSILSLLSVAFLLYIFTFYVDGEMGIILIAFMLVSPIVSLILTVYARERIIVDIDCDGYVNVKSVLKVNVTVEKTGFFPLAIVEVRTRTSEVFEQSDNVYRFSMLGKEKIKFCYDVTAKTGGNGEIEIESVYSCGFMGFLKLKLNGKYPISQNVGVIPEIPEIKTSSQLFRSIADVVLTSDDDEENDTSMLFTSNTVPGYEHREYVEGDPLKRINWKISSKKNKLMVRMDEAASSVQPVIILDLYRNSSEKIQDAVVTEEILLKSVFGLVSGLIKQGIACTFIYYGASGEMISENVDNPDYPSQLLLKVLAVKVVSDRRSAVNLLNESVCACVIATTDCSESISEITDKIENKENISIIGVSADMKNSTDIPLWYLDGDNNFKMV